MARRNNGERERFWREALRRQAQSGQSVREFCLDNGLTQASFYGWRHKLRVRKSPATRLSVQSAAEGERTCEPTAFIPLNVVAGAARVIDVIHPRGHVLRVPAAFDEEAVGRLLSLLDRGPR